MKEFGFVILEDERIIRKSILRIIDSSLPLRCIGEFHDGREARESIERQGLDPDIVLTDSLMPEMDGVEFAKWITLRCPNVLVIFLSGHSEYDLMRSAMQTRAFDYILKPIDRNQLNDTLYKAIRQLNASSSFIVDDDEVFLRELRGVEKAPVREVCVFCLKGAEEACDSLCALLDGLCCYRKAALEDLETKIIVCAVDVLKDEALLDIDGMAVASGSFLGMSGSGSDSLHGAFLQALQACLEAETTGKQGLRRYDDSDGARMICSMLDYLYGHYTDKLLSLQSVADRFGYTYAYASRLLSTSLGTSFTDWITKLRIAKSRELLRCSDRKIAEIAELSGFSSVSYFNKVFKKAEGLTPQEYREMHDPQRIFP